MSTTFRDKIAKVCDRHGIKWKAGTTEENVAVICDKVAADMRRDRAKIVRTIQTIGATGQTLARQIRERQQ